ncbi:Protein of unknown function [Lactobacillus acidophilus DSM 9126]|nr:Protein of unknown function [Lactobacillus acidophilus DSM 20079 = JCM 1132 = NBRC 13951 = CIP 76.13]CDF68504.1 Protein of unknown function [Lactobacillus acidophilus CIRM-BIA 442]CDF72265.1 Protein of unknown function [Lactobacillus acidophilus CIRM-BIA 445]CDF74085.1 Protein of unknown function [Lactobacillus acidophilus DSM 9126]CDF76092.1 Protein of unknown function [Lactobacillus acidophilus DSM 20242]
MPVHQDQERSATSVVSLIDQQY